jgi:two-component system OmpR family sensor kinase
LPIRWRLTIFNALSIGAILLLLGGAIFFLVRGALLSGVEDTVKNRAISAARTIQSGEPLSQEDVERLTLDGVFVIVRNGQGKIVYDTVSLKRQDDAQDSVWRRALRTGEPANGTAELSEEEPDYVYAVPVSPPNSPARVVEAGKSYESTQETLETLGTALAAGVGVVLLVAIAGAYFLARTALRPVDAVVSAAREMSETDLSRRLPVVNHGDEIGRLATTINGFLARNEAAASRREEALARQRSFASDASHELRTPLTAIRGHARMLDEWALDDVKTARKSVRTIRQESDRMWDLVEALMALTRGDEGAPLNISRHDFGKIAEEAVQIARVAANGKVSVEYLPPEKTIEATFDRAQIRRAASILLDNAVKYTPKGGSVEVRVGEEDGQAILEVSDTGVGIAEDQLPLVFERFHRVDPSRTEGGAGLGLSIARQIAESHGGEIRVRSRPGEGSTFTLLLPKNPGS